MYLDNNLLVSGSISSVGAVAYQTVTGASSVLSTNTVDLGTNRDIAAGIEYPKLHAIVGTTFTGLTALEVQAIQADDAALSSNVTVIGSSGAIPVASLTAGKRITVELNTQIASKGQRYLGARYVPTGTGTAGTVLSHFGTDLQDGQKFYTSGFAVS